MHLDPRASFLVWAEETGEVPCGWAWAIYSDVDNFLIARSRSQYWNRQEALRAGTNAAANVRRNLLLRASRASRRAI